MEEFLKTIINNLVEEKDDVEIKQKEAEREITFEVKVAQSDMGRVIGRQGRTARSIRTIMKSIGNKEHKKVNVEFVE